MLTDDEVGSALYDKDINDKVVQLRMQYHSLKKSLDDESENLDIKKKKKWKRRKCIASKRKRKLVIIMMK